MIQPGLCWWPFDYARANLLRLTRLAMCTQVKNVYTEHRVLYWEFYLALFLGHHHPDQLLALRPISVTFAVHKSILTARSEVFEAMLNGSNNLESTTNRLVIKDATPEVLKEFLRFLYTDQVSFTDPLHRIEKFINLCCITVLFPLSSQRVMIIYRWASLPLANEPRNVQTIYCFIMNGFEALAKWHN